MSEFSNKEVFSPEIKISELLIDFDESLALEGIKHPRKISDGVYCLYTQLIAPDIEFTILRDATNSLIFLVDRPGKTGLVDEDKYAEFVLGFCDDGSLEIFHRLVSDKGKEIGLKGSNLLSQIEKYMRFYLIKKKLKKDFHSFLIESGQISVTKWALKNGYHFRNSKDASKFQEILQDDGIKYTISDSENNGGKNYVYAKTNGKQIRFGLVKNIWPKEEVEEKN